MAENFKILNNNQKPILCFTKQILCWSDEGDLIIDATSGTWTTAVSIIYFALCSTMLHKTLTIEIMIYRLMHHGSHIVQSI
jgi:hypothetical protein